MRSETGIRRAARGLLPCAARIALLLLCAGSSSRAAPEAAGLQKGDVVDSLDTKPAATLRLVELRAALADEGSQRVLSITRGEASEKLRIPITIQRVSIEE